MGGSPRGAVGALAYHRLSVGFWSTAGYSYPHFESPAGQITAALVQHSNCLDLCLAAWRPPANKHTANQKERVRLCMGIEVMGGWVAWLCIRVAVALLLCHCMRMSEEHRVWPIAELTTASVSATQMAVIGQGRFAQKNS